MLIGPMLSIIFVAWAVSCVTVAAVYRRAPAASLALLGSVIGSVGGFLIGNADGPAETHRDPSAGEFRTAFSDTTAASEFFASQLF